MYEFHFDYMKKKYSGEKSKVLFTDTDLLTSVIKTKNIYDDMFSSKGFFNFSEYNKDCKYYNTENMKKIGKMKEEMKGIAIAGFVGLRAKNVFNINKKEKGGEKNESGK